MTNGNIYLTAEGAARLKLEVEELKGPKREEIAQRLRSAIQMGDLSENADYHKAKEDQAFLEGRIQELEFTLKHATIIEKGAVADGIVSIGSKVTVQEEDYPPEIFHIVGAKEADSRTGKISNESPIGQALLDRKAGETAEAQTPNGKIRLKILKVE